MRRRSAAIQHEAQSRAPRSASTGVSSGNVLSGTLSPHRAHTGPSTAAGSSRSSPVRSRAIAIPPVVDFHEVFRAVLAFAHEPVEIGDEGFVAVGALRE